MIIALQGGLGNQMFQYAYGISHATDELFFTRNILDADPKRSYQLYGYPVDVKFTVPGPDILYGYWQSESLFDHQLARQAFSRPMGVKSPYTALLSHRIRSSPNSCFVGVRRGDYVTDQAQRDFHGCLPIEYQKTAMQMVRAEYPDATFFIVSDDPAWCREHFSEQVLDGNRDSPWWDVWLMSLCKHAIIANSSFHWWGAWLGGPGMVIAPKRWFVSADDSGIVPDRWIRI